MSVAYWYKCAVSLQHLCTTNGIQYVHCLDAPFRSPAVAALYRKHIATMTHKLMSLLLAPCKELNCIDAPCRSPAVAALYRKHIATMTGRVSSISGVARKDDPAILGWDVFNEPR
jgi:hypothetical protein